MKKLIYGLLFISNVCYANAQYNISAKASQIQFEFLGPGSLFSINYESRFAKKETGLGYKIGLGGSPLRLLGKSCNSGGILTLPAGITFLTGNYNHKFEIGGGGVLAIVGATKVYCMDFDSEFFSDETGPYGYVSVGYRYQPVQKKGMTYRVFISPLFQAGFAPKIWGGVSLGYRW